MSYIVIKAIHIIALVAWFAAMFYLPRLFVYHREQNDRAGFVEVMEIMEQKLYKYIGMPAFIATVVTGAVLLGMNIDLLKSGGWMHAKITLVVLLIAWFLHAGTLIKKLANDKNYKSGKFFRFYNEIPTLFLISIVLLAVVKPF